MVQCDAMRYDLIVIDDHEDGFFTSNLIGTVVPDSP